MDDLIEEVLDLWFEGVVENEMREAWWVQDEAFDAEIRRWFREVQRRASAGELDVWAETPKGSVAPVIVLEKISRNLNRGSDAAVANDPKALAIVEAGIEKDWGGEFREPNRVFFYLPHEHSEDFDVQRRCFRVFFETRMGTEYPEAHIRLVERFGRFPHRNAVLGRSNTPEEGEYFAQTREGFEAG